MRQINISKLRSHLPAYLGKVKRGEELLVTSRGKAVARLMPVQDQREDARAQLMKFRKSCKVGDVVAPIDAIWEVDNACS
jgi:prevent-host-death family protein